MARASVIVPARNAEATLPRTLEALARQDASFDFEVIVVDDGSSDGTRAAAEQAGGRVRVLSQEAAGPAEARNRGVAESTGQALAFCDADCFPVPGWLDAGVGALDRAELVQGRVEPEPDVPLGPFDRTLWIPHEVGLWETANLFTTRSAFERVGGFEDWLRPVAGKAIAEDVWFGWRIRRTGARSEFCPDALAYHAVFARTAAEYIAERRRLRHFPDMVRAMPELREHFLYRRAFLNRRTAALDLAVVAGVASLALGRRWPLVGIAPYLDIVSRRLHGHGGRAWRVAAVDVAADLVGLEALARGSVSSGSPVL